MPDRSKVVSKYMMVGVENAAFASSVSKSVIPSSTAFRINEIIFFICCRTITTVHPHTTMPIAEISKLLFPSFLIVTVQHVKILNFKFDLKRYKNNSVCNTVSTAVTTPAFICPEIPEKLLRFRVSFHRTYYLVVLLVLLIDLSLVYSSKIM